MDEVGGALVSIALVLCAVFVPTAFMRRHLRASSSSSSPSPSRSRTAISLLLLADAFTGARLTDPAAARGQASAGGWNLIARGWEAFIGVFNRGFDAAVAWVCGRRRFRHPAFGGDAVAVRRADRQCRMVAGDHAAGFYSGAGSRLRHHLRAIAGCGFAGAHDRGGARDREDCAGYAGHRARRRICRLLGRDPNAIG